MTTIPMSLNNPAEFAYDDEVRHNAGSRWPVWIRDFEIYSAASGINNAKQKMSLLLHVVGKAARDIYFAKAVKTDGYDEVAKALSDHFAPQKRPTPQRSHRNDRSQGSKGNGHANRGQHIANKLVSFRSNSICRACGYEYPHKNGTECPAKSKKCLICQEVGHFAKTAHCNKRNVNAVHSSHNQANDDDDDEKRNHFAISSKSKPSTINVSIIGTEVNMLIGSGAGGTIIGEAILERIDSKQTSRHIPHEVDEEFLLCKSCGYELAKIQDIFYKKTPHAFHTRNDTELINQSRKNPLNSTVVTVQSVQNPHGSHYDLITLKHADLLRLNETKSIDATWFPNFEWTICVCPKCRTHIGWYFESILDKNRKFFAVIVDRLFSENFADTLVIQPKLKMY